MLCNPVVWKVTLLLRYLKLQRITAVQFVYCFRKKKTSFLGALCYLRSQPHARWTSTLWLLCGTVRIPVFSSCLVVPLTAPLLIIPFFFFFFFSVWGRVSPVLGGSGQARQVWGVLQTHPAYPPHRQHGGDDWLRRRSRRPAPDQQRRQLRQGGVNRSPAPQDLHTETR